MYLHKHFYGRHAKRADRAANHIVRNAHARVVPVVLRERAYSGACARAILCRGRARPGPDGQRRSRRSQL